MKKILIILVTLYVFTACIDNNTNKKNEIISRIVLEGDKIIIEPDNNETVTFSQKGYLEDGKEVQLNGDLYINEKKLSENFFALPPAVYTEYILTWIRQVKPKNPAKPV